MAASQRKRVVTPVWVEKVSTNKKSSDEFSDVNRDDEGRNNSQKQGLAPGIEKTTGGLLLYSGSDSLQSFNQFSDWSRVSGRISSPGQ
ncbi:hypothetical protein TNCV_263081 [Trichonephila clavipes]|nr:hypothetical protein TNCV_263081 [Trichonephila clavipes]